MWINLSAHLLILFWLCTDIVIIIIICVQYYLLNSLLKKTPTKTTFLFVFKSTLPSKKKLQTASTDLKTEASFVFFSSAKVLQESRGSSAEEFCYFDGRSGWPTLCISAMILVALKNNSLIDVLCNRKYFLFVKLIFSVFIFP